MCQLKEQPGKEHWNFSCEGDRVFQTSRTGQISAATSLAVTSIPVQQINSPSFWFCVAFPNSRGERTLPRKNKRRRCTITPCCDSTTRRCGCRCMVGGMTSGSTTTMLGYGSTTRYTTSITTHRCNDTSSITTSGHVSNSVITSRSFSCSSCCSSCCSRCMGACPPCIMSIATSPPGA